jgi:hypothetical protein
MLTVTLKPDVAEQVSQLAAAIQTEADALVDKAVRAYLVLLRQEKIRAETEAFDQQRAQLLEQYRAEYVALHQGQVIDHDPSLRTLHWRVFARLGHTPVLLKPVTMNQKNGDCRA